MTVEIPKWLINYMLYNVGWFACVLGGNFLAVPVTAGILYLHFNHVAEHRQEIYYIILVALIGLLVDNCIFALGALSNAIGTGYPPLWMLCIWVLFASLFNHSLAWLRGRYLLASMLGFIAGPMAYWSGAKLSDVSLAEPHIHSLLVIGSFWALAMPMVLALTYKYESYVSSEKISLE